MVHITWYSVYGIEHMLYDKWYMACTLGGPGMGFMQLVPK